MTALLNPSEVFGKRRAEITDHNAGIRLTSRQAATASGTLALPVNPQPKAPAKPVAAALLTKPTAAPTTAPEGKPTASKPQYRRANLAFKMVLNDPDLEALFPR